MLPWFFLRVALLINGSGDILVMRLALVEVRQCVSGKRRIKVPFPVFAELTAPRLRAGMNVLVYQPREDVMKRLSLILSLLLPITVLGSSASLAQSKLDASILSYDGKDFVRTETTLMNNGQSAANTKLDHDSAAYKALSEKHSYTGPVTVFGKSYQGNYAPLIGADGKVSGALFVGVPK